MREAFPAIRCSTSKIESVLNMIEAHSQGELEAKFLSLELVLGDATYKQLSGASFHLEQVLRR